MIKQKLPMIKEIKEINQAQIALMKYVVNPLSMPKEDQQKMQKQKFKILDIAGSLLSMIKINNKHELIDNLSSYS